MKINKKSVAWSLVLALAGLMGSSLTFAANSGVADGDPAIATDLQAGELVITGSDGSAVLLNGQGVPVTGNNTLGVTATRAQAQRPGRLTGHGQGGFGGQGNNTDVEVVAPVSPYPGNGNNQDANDSTENGSKTSDINE